MPDDRRPAVPAARRRRRVRPDPLALGARRGRGARDRDHRPRDRRRARRRSSSSSSASEKAFQKFLDQSGFTHDEARQRIELQLDLRPDPEGRAAAATRASPTTRSRTYYDANIAQFEQPETRDVRVILTKTEAEANQALAALGSTTLAEDLGGGREEVLDRRGDQDDRRPAPGRGPGPVRAGARRADLQRHREQLVGPFKGDAGYYVIEVEKITPAQSTTRRLDDVRRADHARRSLVASRQQEIAQDFQDDFQTKWIARTFCAEGYRIDRCSNAEPPPRPVHRGARREPGLRRAGAVRRSRSRPGTNGVFGSPAADRPAAGPDHARHRPPPPGGSCPRASSPAACPGGTAPPGTAAGTVPHGQPAAGRPRRPRRRPAADAWTRSRRSSASTRSPAGCGASAPGTASRTSARSSRTRSRRPTSSPTPPRSGDDEKLRDELGDVLFQVVFLSLLLEERGAGSLGQVAERADREADPPPPARLRTKQDEVRRPPARCCANWDTIKREVEGRGADDPFADVPENLPGLLYARKILRRAEPEGGGAGRPRDARRGRARRWGRCCSRRCGSRAGSGSTPSSRSGGRRPASRPAPAERNPLASRSANGRRSRHIHARQILDSRGNPTVEVDVRLDSGALRPRRGALGRLDRRVRGDRAARRRRRLGRQGRRPRRSRTSTTRSPRRSTGARATDQVAIDETLRELDGTPNKSRLGRERDPRRLAGGRARRRGRGRACRSTSTSPSSTGSSPRRGDGAAGADDERDQRRRPRRQLGRPAGVHGRPGGRAELLRGPADRAPRSSTR